MPASSGPSDRVVLPSGDSSAHITIHNYSSAAAQRPAPGGALRSPRTVLDVFQNPGDEDEIDRNHDRKSNLNPFRCITMIC
eukprot:TRINITY_DN3737_c0_g1_i1.p1 TRINITY_DN3737_c0_g1~~TRINITY_DN3737_c0_g1_i1.p1  ORF type:complete len:81 (-),score=8.86 TRINITY_DN3737_c0_g1_i1:318-560(-)